MRVDARLRRVSCELLYKSRFYMRVDFAGRAAKKSSLKESRTPRFDMDLHAKFEMDAAKALGSFVELHVYDAVGKRKGLVGVCRVELDDLLLSPRKHRLLLWKKGSVVGRLAFECDAVCKTCAEVRVADAQVANIPSLHGHKPRLGITLESPDGHTYADINAGKNMFWEWKHMDPVKFWASTAELAEARLVVRIFSRRREICAAAFHFAKIMRTAFAGRPALVEAKLKMAEESRDFEYAEPAVIKLSVTALYLCKYVQMVKGTHEPGVIIGGEQLLRDLPMPNLEAERPDLYENSLAAFTQELRRLRRREKGGGDLRVEAIAVRPTSSRGGSTPVVRATVVGETKVFEGEVLPSRRPQTARDTGGGDGYARRGWKKIRVTFEGRPFKFTLVSGEDGSCWVDTVSRKSLRSAILPGSIVYKINGQRCEGASFQTTISMLRSCSLPARIKFKVPPHLRSVKNSDVAHPHRLKRFNKWYDENVRPDVEGHAVRPMSSREHRHRHRHRSGHDAKHDSSRRYEPHPPRKPKQPEKKVHII